LLSLWRLEIVSTGVRSTLFGVTGTVTAISGFHYIYRGLRWYQQKGGAAAVVQMEK
jgi:hypothetical protein